MPGLSALILVFLDFTQDPGVVVTGAGAIYQIRALSPAVPALDRWGLGLLVALMLFAGVLLATPQRFGRPPC